MQEDDQTLIMSEIKMGIFDKLFGKKENEEKKVNSDAKKINYLINAFTKAFANSQFGEAIKHLEELVQIFKEIGDRKNESKCYTSLGIAYRNLGDFNKAIQCHEKSLEIFKDVGDRAGESKCYTNLGNAYLSLGDFNKAIQCHENSLEINKYIGDRAGESKCYTNLGVAYHGLGDFRKAIELYEKSLEIFKDVGDRVGESKCYQGLGVAYRNLGDFKKAIQYHEKSLEIFKDVGDRAGESACYTKLGAAYRSLGYFKKAIKYHEGSLEIAKDIGDMAGESKCYMNLGNAYQGLGDFSKAIQYYENSLKIAKDIGDRVGESKCYTNLGLGVAYSSLGDFRKAIGLYENSLEIFKDVGDRADESKCYMNLGNAYQGLGDFNKAIQYHKMSLKINKDIGDRVIESAGYGNLGLAYDSLGDFDKAIKYHEDSLEIAQEIGDKAGEAKCYTNLGIAYQSLGDFDKAIKLYNGSLEIAKAIGDKSWESACYGNLGLAHQSLGEFNKAIKYHEDYLEIAKAIGNKSGEAKCYGGLGIAYQSLGDFDKAIKRYKDSLEIAKAIGDKTMEAICYTNLGIAYRSLGDFNKAIKFYEDSLKIAKAIGDKTVESGCYTNFAVIYYHNKQDYQKSLDYARKSIKITEQVRESLIEEELSLTFLKTKIGVYDLAINSSINLYKETNKESYLKDALEIIERTKSRELMKIIKAKKKDPEAEKEYHELKGVEIKIGELEAKIKSAVEGKRSVEREVQEKNELHKKRSELYKKIREKSLDPSSIVPTLDEDITKEFWGVFGKHADNCSVLQIYEQEERIIYVLFNKEKFEFFEKEVTGEGRKLVGEQLGNMRDPYMPASTYYENLKNIIGIILPENLIGKLGDIKTKELFIIPHKWLHQIPWEAVLVGGEPLCLRYNMVRHYSLDLIRSSLIYEKRENKNALLVSNPKPSEHSDLPGAEVECNKIKDILKKFNVIHLNREYAKIDEVEKNVLNTSIIHFACHGSFNSNDPFESSVLFSSDKKLSANDISLKNLDYYPLVFLNACETGITTSDKVIGGVGDEQIGLVRAFAMAHSPAIIVAGWRIDDAVAKYFAEKFYNALSDNNLAGALSSAREKTYKKFRGKHKDWAAYMLYGNPFRRL